jgi:protein-tyrosine kinase
MSRVDEAMRRSGDGALQAEHDTAALAREPFPIELPERHRPHVDPGRTPPQKVDRAGSETPANPAAPAPERLFERFDARVVEKIVIDRRMDASCREQYRRLAGVLHDAQAERRIQVVMVASAVAGEGKTLTTANLALTLSSSYRKRVLVIDGDLRGPVQHRLFRIESSSGLVDSLDAPADAKIIVRQVTPMLALLPGGRPSADPMAGLISDRMRRLIEEAREFFDWVIIDTPPLMLLPDANLLAAIVDGALLVVRAESTPHAMVKRAVDAIGKARILGVVLNRATVDPHCGYSQYDSYSSGTYNAPTGD